MGGAAAVGVLAARGARAQPSRPLAPPPDAQVGQLELLQAPGLQYQLPRAVAGLPELTGGWRAGGVPG